MRTKTDRIIQDENCDFSSFSCNASVKPDVTEVEKSSMISFRTPHTAHRAFALCFSLFTLLIISCSSPRVESSASRYVVTSPTIAEIVALLDGKKNIVGVAMECDYPANLKDIPIVGTFGKIDYEKVINLNPTYVFTSGLEQAKVAEELGKLGLKTQSFYSHSIDEMYEIILQIGNIIGKSERANFVVDSLQTQISNLNILNKLDAPKVYVEIYGDPIMTVSDSSFVGNIVEMVGANNVFDNLPRDYSRISPEKVLNAMPDVMIITYPGVSAEQVRERKGWNNIPAVKNNRIYTVEDINPDLILRSSPRIVQGMQKLLEILGE